AVYSAADQMLRSISDRGLGSRSPAQKITLVHPGSGAREKCWPVDRFVDLISQLKTKGHNVRVVVGEVEQERLAPQDLARLAGVAEVIQLNSYLELLEQLKSAHGFIGNDSGPSHLAGALATRTLALFGPTNPRIWRPLGPRVHTLRHQPLADLSVQAVLAALISWPRPPK